MEGRGAAQLAGDRAEAGGHLRRHVPVAAAEPVLLPHLATNKVGQKRTICFLKGITKYPYKFRGGVRKFYIFLLFSIKKIGKIIISSRSGSPIGSY